MLILICGLPGTGKTTLARAYAGAVGALHLNSDVLRHELGLMGHYLPADKQKVYDALLDRTRNALQQGRDVVVDSTFYKESLREPFRQIAGECQTPIHWVEVKAGEQTVAGRTGRLRPDSEADYAVYLKIKAEFEPITEPHLVLWSDAASLKNMVTSISQYIHAEPNQPAL